VRQSNATPSRRFVKVADDVEMDEVSSSTAQRPMNQSHVSTAEIAFAQSTGRGKFARHTSSFSELLSSQRLWSSGVAGSRRWQQRFWWEVRRWSPRQLRSVLKLVTLWKFRPKFVQFYAYTQTNSTSRGADSGPTPRLPSSTSLENGDGNVGFSAVQPT